MDNYHNQVYKRYQALEGEYLFVDQAVNFIVGILELFNFDNDQLYSTFNGGKDATVVLYLTVIALQRKQYNQRIKCIYFDEKEPFQEVDDFRIQQQKVLDLEIITITKDKKQGLADLKQTTQIKAVLMGTRSTDPFSGNLEKITMTDSGYPAMLRLNPILYWTFEQVWIFLREYKIPYCILYEQGYTYLGNKSNTVPNESLRNKDDTYQPACNAIGITELSSRKQCIEDL